MRALIAALLSLAATPALAAGEVGPLANARSLGMGGTLRGSAAGDAALALNPSGMPLVRTYAIEGEYLHATGRSENDAHVSIVDSTSGFNVSGGLYYTYLSASPGGSQPDRAGHEGGFALAIPFGDKLAIGGTVKYARLTTKGGDMMLDTKTQGFNFDAGITLKPFGILSVGAVAYNLHDVPDRRMPFGIGGGLTVAPIEGLLLAADMLWDAHGASDNGGATHFMGGGEFTFAKRLAVRAGGGHRGGMVEGGYGSAGLTFISEVGAIDGGVQQGFGGLKETLFVVAARLFVPSP
jgi:hypothetical protein